MADDLAAMSEEQFQNLLSRMDAMLLGTTITGVQRVRLVNAIYRRALQCTLPQPEFKDSESGGAQGATFDEQG